MSGPDDQERAKELARLWQGSVVPVEDENVLEARRARVVPTIGGVIGRAAERRLRERSFRRMARSIAAAAAVLGAVSVGYLVKANHAAQGTAKVAGLDAKSGPARSGVRALSGVVTLMHESQESVIERSALAIGDSVSTAANATAEMALTDLVVASVGSSSEVDIVAPRAAFHRLRLDRGRLDAKVDDRASSTPKLVVETPDVEVVVTGTIFEVDVVRPDPSTPSVTRVSVSKGRVVVRRAGVEVAAVSAGQSWTSAVAPLVAAAPQAPLTSAVVSREAERTVAAHVIAERTLPTASLPSAANLAEVQMGTLAEENALYQSAVEARSRGDDASAAGRLGKLLARYPASLLSTEARVERMRALARSGRASEAAREARRYLADHPDGYAREEAKRLVMPGETAQ
ncbi:MAG TPA: FecR domain-containing protein [Polyangiaceae bacterium]